MFPLQSEYVAAAVNVHRKDLFGDAGVKAFARIMQLADGGKPVPRSLHTMPPAWHAPVIGKNIVPIPGLMRIATGGKCRAGGNADGRRGISVGEARAPCGKTVDIGRLHDSVAIAADRLGRHFIHHHDQKIGCRHLSPDPLAGTSSPRRRYASGGASLRCMIPTISLTRRASVSGSVIGVVCPGSDSRS